MKLFLPGGAGLVGLNLINQINNDYPDWEVIVVDKKEESIDIAKKLFSDSKISFICEDLNIINNTKWPSLIKNCDACVMLQAEIGNTDKNQFWQNNVESTVKIIKELKKNNVKRLVHISSSVVNSVSNDSYTITKRKQEEIVKKEWKDPIILSPTLMFGLFDRKHLGWLAKFMKKFFIFPIPGNGRFIRQPLYVGDFCKVIISCLLDYRIVGVYEITGQEKISYISLMKLLRKTISAKTYLIKLPIPIFGFLLQIWALIASRPAFTKSQLKALTSGDQFAVLDWPKIFKVEHTSIKKAFEITFKNKKFSNIDIPF